ncbi:uncharacterized protein LOC111049910 isoform X8 [Nilaparvata lugens]|uniref:uncharacterized protein LOC111049910 isoform X8 n=1 Tax=Nilaparvata lugens TaxID=108931 RepID=UPI00193EBA21|nr:uncharacterized protein LOC111049910 isoform X8 [Nilaparvata lugens]
MEYHICKKIAKVVIERLKDGSPTSSQENRFQVKIEKEECETNHIEEEPQPTSNQVKIERGICETNHIKEEPQPNSNQMESVSVKMEEEEDDSSQQPAAWSPVEDNSDQQHLIPGYNLIFIKEESYGTDISNQCGQVERWSNDTEYQDKINGENHTSISQTVSKMSRMLKIIQ